MNQINATRFQTVKEITAAYPCLDITEKEYKVAGTPLYVEGNNVYVDHTDSHTVVFGATGSKKTRLLVMPSIEIFCRAGESFLVTDPKGEIYDKTGASVEKSGHDVLCINLRDLKNSHCWNPFKLPFEYYHGGEKGTAMEMLNEIANMIISKDELDEAYWANAGKDLLVGFLVLMMERCKNNPETCGFRKLVDLWREYRENSKFFKERVRNEFSDSVMAEKISIIYNTSERTLGSVEAIVSTGLNKLLLSEELIDFLSRDDFNLKESIKNKTAIYLVIPDENTSYHFVVSLFISQLYELLIREAQSRPERALEYRMNFMIDEFANIPKITNMVPMITAARSRNIRFYLILQGLAQINMKYGDETEVLFGNCNNWIYLYSKEKDLLKQLSFLCGEIIYENGTRIPLISEFELQHMNKEKGEALVLAGRSLPFITQLRDIDDYVFPEPVPGKEDVERKISRQNKEVEPEKKPLESMLKSMPEGAGYREGGGGARKRIKIWEYKEDGVYPVSGVVALVDEKGVIKEWVSCGTKQSEEQKLSERRKEVFEMLNMLYGEERMKQWSVYFVRMAVKRDYEMYRRRNPWAEEITIYDVGGVWLKL